MENFGLHIWGEDNFIIENGTININHASKPSLLHITQTMRKSGHKGPLLLRFPHLIEKQISTLFSTFKKAKEAICYKGEFHAVFPLKVNQFPNFLNALMDVSQTYNYGLEAGSKAELIIAMTKTPIGAPITVNGFPSSPLLNSNLAFAKSPQFPATTVTYQVVELKSSI